MLEIKASYRMIPDRFKTGQTQGRAGRGAVHILKQQKQVLKTTGLLPVSSPLIAVIKNTKKFLVTCVYIVVHSYQSIVDIKGRRKKIGTVHCFISIQKP